MMADGDADQRSRPDQLLLPTHSDISGDDKAGRIGDLNDFVRDAAKQQPGQGAATSPANDDDIGPLRPRHADDDPCGVSDFHERFQVQRSFLAGADLRRFDDCPAALLKHFILGPLHMLHPSQFCQLVPLITEDG